jgi:hypothetical protein
MVLNWEGARVTKIPAEIILELEQETEGLTFGSVRLEIVLHDGYARYKITREKSIVPGKPSSGAEKADRLLNGERP